MAEYDTLPVGPAERLTVFDTELAGDVDAVALAVIGIECV